MKQLALYTAVCLATLAGLLLLWHLRLMVLLLILAVFVAAAVRPFSQPLQQIGLPPSIANTLVYIMGLSGFALAFYFIGRPLLTELDLFTNSLIIRYENTYLQWREGSQIQHLLYERLPAPDDLVMRLSQDQTLIPFFFNVTQGLLTGLGGLILILALSIYWNADQNHLERFWLSLLPAVQRTQVRELWRNLETAVGRYVRLEILQSAIVALLLWLVFSLLEINYPIILAVTGALAWFIPLVGVVFAAAAAYWVGLMHGTFTAVAALVFTVLIMGLMEYIIEPRYFKHRKYSPLLILLVTIPLVQTLGLIGIVLASPIAVTIQTLLAQFYNAQTRPTLISPAAQLEDRHRQLVLMLADSETNSHKAEMNSILDRLQQLIREAETILDR